MRVRLRFWIWAFCAATITTAQADRADAASGAGSTVEVLSYDLAANQDTPELCFQLSQTVIRQPDPPLESFVTAEPAAKLSARPRNNKLCVTGFGFGVTYTVTLKAGLPGLSGTLARDAQFRLQVPDRPPELSFVSPTAEILPRLGGEGLPIRTVNTQAVAVQVFRISDRDVLKQSRLPLTGDMVAGFAPAMGEPVWRGALEPKGEPNRDAVTFLPVDKTLGALKPGLYVAVAWPAGFPAVPGKRSLPTQYFTVSDFGLSAYRGMASMIVGVRSLSAAAPVQDVDIAVLAANNRELGRARTDENGLARFDGNSLLGIGEDRPVMLYAYGAAAEFGALPIDGSSALAEFADSSSVRTILQTDRAKYRAGDTVSFLALVRNLPGATAPKPRLTIDIYRPNGALFDSLSLEDGGAGGYRADFKLPRWVESGRWRLEATSSDNAAPAAGKTAFDVAGPDAENLSVTLSADVAVLDPAQPGAVAVQTRYADGQAGVNSPGEATLSIQPAVNPFPAFPGFSFGLADEIDPAITLDPVRFSTDATGQGSIPLRFGLLPNAAKPLDARVKIRVLDTGGRPIEQATTIPIATQNLFFGIKPANAGSFPEGQATHFEVVALSRDGATQDRPGAGWEIVRRDFNPAWAWDGTRFAYHASIKDNHVAGGNVDVPADSPGVIDVNLPAGRYRIEVFDPKGEAISSAYFSVGWAPSEAGVAADSINLTPSKLSYSPGEAEDIFVKPPYDSDVTLVTAGNTVRSALVQHVTAAGANVHIDTPRDARAGLMLLASAVAPAAAIAPGLPRRAVGSLELPAEPASHELEVKLDLPEKAVPGQKLAVPVSVTGAGDEPAFVEVVASDGQPGREDDADDERLVSNAIGNATTPPLTAFDNYGRIITPSGLSAGDTPTVEVNPPGRAVAAETPNTQTVSMSSGIVAIDKNGKGSVPLALPDFTGKLTVRAIAWSAGKLGQARSELQLHHPLATELRLPETLAVEDRAELSLALRNVDGPRGEYHVKLHADGAVTLQDDAEIVVNLAEHEQRFQPVTVIARASGAGNLAISVKGPGGIDFERHLAIGVHAVGWPMTRHANIVLKPGASLSLDPSLTTGLHPETVKISLAASASGAFDLPLLGAELRQADYQSAERVVDRATPALAPSSAPPGVAPRSGVEPDAVLQSSARTLFDLQSPDGGFGLWGAGPSDPWLSAYVTEFMTRARAAGAMVPEAPFIRALDYLERLGALEPAPPGATPPSQGALEAMAYAGKVLAMNGRLDVFQLRYFGDRMTPQIHSPVTMALMAASFAALGDKITAAGLFSQAAAILGTPPAPDGFGSDLRDQAMLTALMAESGAAAQPLIQGSLTRLFADAGAHRQFTAQEAAWIFRAQSAAGTDAGGVNLKFGDQVLQQAGIAHMAAKPGEPALPPIKNLGDMPARVAATIMGIPAQPDAKDQAGYEVQRTLFDTMGKALEPMALKQNDLAVVVLSGRYSGPGEGKPVLIDPLPAGWQMDSASIADPGARYPWLKDLSGETALSLENGVYVATPILTGERHEFKVAYVVRASVRGQFAIQGAIVEDMAQPALSVRGAGGRTKIDSPAL